MMVILAVLAITGLASGHIRVPEKVEIARISQKNIDHLLEQYINFIPYDKCLEIDEKYYINDPEVRAAYDFYTSDEYAALANKLEELPEYQQANNYLIDAGLDVYKYSNALRRIFNLPPIEPNLPKGKSSESGIIAMVLEILNVIPVHEIKEWFESVCLADPNFQYFLSKIKSQEYIDLVNEINSSPESIELFNALLSHGIDFNEIMKVINDYIDASYRIDDEAGLWTPIEFKHFLPFILEHSRHHESRGVLFDKRIP